MIFLVGHKMAKYQGGVGFLKNQADEEALRTIKKPSKFFPIKRSYFAESPNQRFVFFSANVQVSRNVVKQH